MSTHASIKLSSNVYPSIKLSGDVYPSVTLVGTGFSQKKSKSLTDDIEGWLDRRIDTAG